MELEGLRTTLSIGRSVQIKTFTFLPDQRSESPSGPDLFLGYLLGFAGFLHRQRLICAACPCPANGATVRARGKRLFRTASNLEVGRTGLRIAHRQPRLTSGRGVRSFSLLSASRSKESRRSGINQAFPAVAAALGNPRPQRNRGRPGQRPPFNLSNQISSLENSSQRRERLSQGRRISCSLDRFPKEHNPMVQKAMVLSLK